MNATVSIIIPVYNSSKTLNRCLDSIIKNTYKDYELILVNDGSKDNSYDICLDYSKKYSFIRVIQNDQNRGVSYTRNHGLKVAKGKYIIFIDSDDWVEENYIESLVNMIELNNNSLIICGFVNEDMKYGNKVSNYVYDEVELINQLKLDDSILDLYDRNLIQQLWNKIFIRSIIANNDIIFEESMSIGEDTRFILNYLRYLNPKDIIFLNECLYHYMRDQENSLMFNTGHERIENLIENMELLFDLTSLDKEIKLEMITQRKKSMIENYAYIIYHNPKMSEKMKKELIYKLDTDKGLELYKKNRILFLKEKIKQIFK